THTDGTVVDGSDRVAEADHTIGEDNVVAPEVAAFDGDLQQALGVRAVRAAEAGERAASVDADVRRAMTYLHDRVSRQRVVAERNARGQGTPLEEMLLDEGDRDYARRFMTYMNGGVDGIRRATDTHLVFERQVEVPPAPVAVTVEAPAPQPVVTAGRRGR